MRRIDNPAGAPTRNMLAYSPTYSSAPQLVEYSKGSAYPFSSSGRSELSGGPWSILNPSPATPTACGENEQSASARAGGVGKDSNAEFIIFGRSPLFTSDAVAYHFWTFPRQDRIRERTISDDRAEKHGL